jgi:hemerythrin-like metal-binding protein
MMLDWTQGGYALGLESMDGNHREFVLLARRLAETGDGEFAALFQQLVDHTRLHFAEEGRLMRLHGFPALGEHEGEHHRVFGDLLQFNRQIKRGRLALPRAYVRQGLPEWFDLHLRTMDAALARHIATHASDNDVAR